MTDHRLKTELQMTEATPILELRGVTRLFAGGAVRAVDGLDLDVVPAEIVSLLGPSGCGKTTAMRMIAGLDSPDSGDIRIAGRSVLDTPPHRRNVGLVFQSLAIFPHMTVRKNVAFGLRMKGLPAAKIGRRVDSLLDLVRLPPDQFGDRYPSQLSGGQLQRVALARTLVPEPAVVLFDEPMAALDRRLRDYMAVELRQIQKTLGIAAIYVTHDQETACTMSDRIAIMEGGKIAQIGKAADLYNVPKDSFTAEFLGDANLIVPDSVERRGNHLFVARLGRTSLEVEGSGESQDGQTLVMFRPEHVDLRTRSNGDHSDMEGTIVGSQFAAGQYRWQIELENRSIVSVRSTENPASDLGPGVKVWISIKPGRARLLHR
jgi:putative spermidine/putrescine transport system ATP-binding protein